MNESSPWSWFTPNCFPYMLHTFPYIFIHILHIPFLPLPFRLGIIIPENLPRRYHEITHVGSMCLVSIYLYIIKFTMQFEPSMSVNIPYMEHLDVFQNNTLLVTNIFFIPALSRWFGRKVGHVKFICHFLNFRYFPPSIIMTKKPSIIAI